MFVVVVDCTEPICTHYNQGALRPASNRQLSQTVRLVCPIGCVAKLESHADRLCTSFEKRPRRVFRAVLDDADDAERDGAKSSRYDLARTKPV